MPAFHRPFTLGARGRPVQHERRVGWPATLLITPTTADGSPATCTAMRTGAAVSSSSGTAPLGT